MASRLQNTINEMMALGHQLIAEAKKLQSTKDGRPGKTRVGPRKGVSEEARKRVVGRFLKNALTKRA